MFFWTSVVMTSSSCLAAIGIPIALYVVMVFRSRRMKSNSNHNKKLPVVLPLGWIQTTLGMTSNDAPWFLLNWARKIGYVFRVRIPYIGPVFVVGDPIVAKDILNDPCSTKPRTFYFSINTAMGASCFFAANGERWRHARKATALAFSTTHIARMKQICKEKLEDWIQRRLLQVFCHTDQAFDPAKEMILLSLSVICQTAFEYEMDDDEATYFVEELNVAIAEFVLRQGDNPIRATWFGYLFGYREICRAQKASRIVRAFMEKILHNYRAKQQQQQQQANAAGSTTKTGTVIECIVNNNNYLNDKERIADLLIFLVGGHDANAYSIAWTLIELARNPHVVNDVRNQLASLPSDEERFKCPALDHVIKEAMRLHPVAAIAGVRETHRDFPMNNDGNTTVIIPKDSVVIIAILLFHRNPQFYDQPDQFIPDRWKSKTQDAAAAGGAYMPFLLGPRSCIGQALAAAQLQSVIARLLMDYDWEVIDPGKPDYTLNMKPLGALLKAHKISSQ